MTPLLFTDWREYVVFLAKEAARPIKSLNSMAELLLDLSDILSCCITKVIDSLIMSERFNGIRHIPEKVYH
jgi:hypothetical protein